MLKKILYGIGGFFVLTFILVLIVPKPDQPSTPAEEQTEETTQEPVAVAEPKETQPENKPQENQEITKSDRCEDVPDEKVAIIEQQFNSKGLSLRGAHAVKSNDFENVYFISADIQGPGMEGDREIATFSTNNIADEKGLIMTTDAMANEFFDWFHGADSDAETSMSDDGAEESAECVRQVLKSQS